MSSMSIFRLALFAGISGGILMFMHYNGENISHNSQFMETWIKMNHQIDYINNNTLPWTDRLEQKWTNINFHVSSFDYMFSTSVFYNIISDDVLRLFTFNLIHKRTLDITILVNDQKFDLSDMILTLQSANIQGIIVIGNIYYNIWEDLSSGSNQIINYKIGFYVVNIITLAIITSYIIFLFIKNKTQIINDMNFPLMNDVISTIFHTFIIWFLCVIPIMISYYSNYVNIKILIYWFIVAYICISFIFLIPYYFMFYECRIFTILQHVFNVVIRFVVLINIIYLSNLFLWLFFHNYF